MGFSSVMLRSIYVIAETAAGMVTIGMQKNKKQEIQADQFPKVREKNDEKKQDSFWHRGVLGGLL